MNLRLRLFRPEIPAFAGTTLMVLLLALFALVTPAAAQNFPERPKTPVLDQAGILRPEQVVDISSKSQALYASSRRTFFVAIVKSLDGATVEDYGGGLLRAWKVGDAKNDDGVILLVAPADRKVRIETGYGAEGFLPDILAGRIIRDTIVPRFKAGDMSGGVVAGADQIMRQMALPMDQQQANVAAAERQQAKQSGEVNFLPVIIIVIIFFSIVGSNTFW